MRSLNLDARRRRAGEVLRVNALSLITGGRSVGRAGGDERARRLTDELVGGSKESASWQAGGWMSRPATGWAGWRSTKGLVEDRWANERRTGELAGWRAGGCGRARRSAGKRTDGTGERMDGRNGYFHRCRRTPDVRRRWQTLNADCSVNSEWCHQLRTQDGNEESG